MTHIYNVSGMTCGGCKASVESALLVLPDIEAISIDLEKTEALITMKTHVATSVLQNALPDKYRITEVLESNIIKPVTEKREFQKSELQQLLPLFLIFSYIISASVLLNIKPWDGTAFMLDFMGLFYIVFSFFKLLDLKGFPESFSMYDPLAKVFPVYGKVYPFIELALGIAFLMRFNIEIALIVTLIILGTTTFGVTKALLNKSAIQCACLGTALKLPMTKATFIENSIMLAMASIMLIKTYVS